MAAGRGAYVGMGCAPHQPDYSPGARRRGAAGRAARGTVLRARRRNLPLLDGLSVAARYWLGRDPVSVPRGPFESLSGTRRSAGVLRRLQNRHTGFAAGGADGGAALDVTTGRLQIHLHDDAGRAVLRPDTDAHLAGTPRRADRLLPGAGYFTGHQRTVGAVLPGSGA